MSEKVLKIYTDGACSGNPGPGGWGAVMIWGETIKEISGFESETTNNRMELMAAIEGLMAIKKMTQVEVYTDSEYVKKGISEWIKQWQITNWKGGKVKNRDLWERLVAISEKYKPKWYWVKGHAENEFNNRADLLARTAIKQAKLTLK